MTAGTTLHPMLTMDDVNGDTVRLVQCPECGQMEIWTDEELRDHGMCRTRGSCPVCGQTSGMEGER